MSAYILDISWDRERSTDPVLPQLVGPFQTRQEAVDWAHLNIVNGNWNAAPLANPYATSGHS